jgi:ribulose-phosphate 3-epimerase
MEVDYIDRTVLVAPSILACDFGRLIDECNSVISSGADWLHIDVMDGSFVPNLTIGPPVLTCIRKAFPNIFLDCHLMVSNPFKWIKPFAEAGASSITFHWECFANNEAAKVLVSAIHSLGCKAGMAIKPCTEISEIEGVLDILDMLLVMTVEPGFGGQPLNGNCLDKISQAKKIRPDLLVQVDGGVSLSNARHVQSKGADVLVAGTAIFKAEDRAEAIKKIGNQGH